MAQFALTTDQVSALAGAFAAQGWWKQVSYDGANLTVPNANASAVQNFDYSAAGAAATAAANKAAAQIALDKSDVTLLRCVENGVAIPAEWTTYRHSLRTILTSGAALPSRPAYPAGT